MRRSHALELVEEADVVVGQPLHLQCGDGLLLGAATSSHGLEEGGRLEGGDGGHAEPHRLLREPLEILHVAEGLCAAGPRRPPAARRVHRRASAEAAAGVTRS